MIKITDIQGNTHYFEDSAIVETISNDEARRQINRMKAAEAANKAAQEANKAAQEAVKEEAHEPRTAHKEPEPNFDDVAKIIKQRRQHGSGYNGVIAGNLSW